MGEILIPSTLVGMHSPKLSIKNKVLSQLKRASYTKSTLLETENPLIGQNISKDQNEPPPPKKHKKLFLEECQVVLDLPLSMNIKEKQLLRRKILDNGGTISYIVTRKSDIVISVGQELSSLKQKMARKYGVPVVMQSYIDNCIAEQRVLDTKEFLVSSGLKTDGFCKGKIIADSDSLPGAKSTSVPLASLTPHSCDEMNGYVLVKAVLLKGRNLHKAGMNKRLHFYVLELHTSSGEKDIDRSKQFCVCTDEGYLDKEQNGNLVSRKKQCYYVETAGDALSVYSQLYFLKAGQPHCMIEANELLHPSLGTPEFQKLQLEWNATLIRADKSILCLVNVIWMEAIGHLNKFLALSPEFIPLWKVEEAEGILLQISTISSRDNWEEMAERLTVEFYSILPHHPEFALPIVSKKILSQKQDLCQVLRDMVSVSEASGWSLDGHLQAKYRALRCHIENLISHTEEYEKIKELLINSQHHASGIVIEEIYRVHRYLETAEFTHHLSNKRLLFHATSPSNLVGILSQGLNLPKVVVQERGVDRFDIGMLGGGIYFTDSLSTCIKYSRKSKERETRFLLMSEVALGNVYETTTFDTSLTTPPDGFNSVHGVKATESEPSDFMDDEFVIYSPCQQRMCYLVEFSLPEDTVKPYCVKEDEGQPDSTGHGIYTLDMKDTIEKLQTKQTSRLHGTYGTVAIEVPLREVHIRAKLLDLVAQVVVFQKYKNLNNSPLECKYVFPLERGAAVCGFEAFINNKHVVGKIKRKEVAHKEYKEAISKGHGAYLMDEESPDIFTVSVGNIPPLATVIIKITYILELPVNDEVISFNVPTSVAPWIKNQAKNQVTQDVTDSFDVEGSCTYSVLISVEMPFLINTISSPTHDILMKRTETMAVVGVMDPSMDSCDGFSLLISLKEIHVPRMWTETREDDSSQASMLVFYPEFEVKQDQCSEIIIVLDASNSMRGDAFQSALQVAALCLMEIPRNCYFNIVAFGTVFQELFPASHECNSTNIRKAKTFLKNIMPSFGNTELFHLLRYYNLTAGNTVKNVIIISDGHVNNEGTVLQNAKVHCSKVRLFTCGISSTANKHMLCQLACWGGGAFEFMDPTDKSNWKSKSKAQIGRAMQAALANVRIEWQNFTDSTDFLQAPQQIMSIFNGCRQVVYGFVPNCTMAKLVAVIDGKEYETLVSSSSLNEPEGTMLHTLAARAIIRDWEDGLLTIDRISNLAEKKLKEEQIVELSKEYNLVTSITSFIAVEERDGDEEISTNEDLLIELLGEVDVDQLEYMEFESLAKGQTKSYNLSAGQASEKKVFDVLRAGTIENVAFCPSFPDSSEESSELFTSSSSDDAFDDAPKLRGTPSKRLSAPPTSRGAISIDSAHDFTGVFEKNFHESSDDQASEKSRSRSGSSEAEELCGESKIQRLKRYACPIMHIPLTSKQDNQREKKILLLEETDDSEGPDKDEGELYKNGNSNSRVETQDGNLLDAEKFGRVSKKYHFATNARDSFHFDEQQQLLPQDDLWKQSERYACSAIRRTSSSHELSDESLNSVDGPLHSDKDYVDSGLPELVTLSLTTASHEELDEILLSGFIPCKRKKKSGTTETATTKTTSTVDETLTSIAERCLKAQSLDEYVLHASTEHALMEVGAELVVDYIKTSSSLAETQEGPPVTETNYKEVDDDIPLSGVKLYKRKKKSEVDDDIPLSGVELYKRKKKSGTTETATTKTTSTVDETLTFNTERCLEAQSREDYGCLNISPEHFFFEEGPDLVVDYTQTSSSLAETQEGPPASETNLKENSRSRTKGRKTGTDGEQKSTGKEPQDVVSRNITFGSRSQRIFRDIDIGNSFSSSVSPLFGDISLPSGQATAQQMGRAPSLSGAVCSSTVSSFNQDFSEPKTKPITQLQQLSGSVEEPLMTPSLNYEECRNQMLMPPPAHNAPFGTTHPSPFAGVPSTLFKPQATQQAAPALFSDKNSFPISLGTPSFGKAESQVSSAKLVSNSCRVMPLPLVPRSSISLSFGSSASANKLVQQQHSFAMAETANVVSSDPQNLSSGLEDSNNQFGFGCITVDFPIHLQYVENVSKFLKDLLKCKGGLPLCNAVFRHICTFARENDVDMRELMDMTSLLDGWELEEVIDMDRLNFRYKDAAFIEIFKAVVEKVKTNGYCEEIDCLKLGIMEPFASILEDGGLNSLGNKAALEIRRMLATLAAIMYFACWLLTVAKEKISGQHNFQKLENLSRLFAFTLIHNFPLTAPVFVALQFVRSVEQRHPLVYKSLNCGNNWEEFIIDYVAKSQNPPVRLSWEEIFSDPKASECYIATE